MFNANTDEVDISAWELRILLRFDRVGASVGPNLQDLVQTLEIIGLESLNYFFDFGLCKSEPSIVVQLGLRHY